MIELCLLTLPEKAVHGGLFGKPCPFAGPGVVQTAEQLADSDFERLDRSRIAGCVQIAKRRLLFGS
jgi:hypothetical protein